MLKYLSIMVCYSIFFIPSIISEGNLHIDYFKYREIIQKQEIEIVVKKVIQCESEGKHNIWGDNGKSYGWFQFQKESFYHISKKMGFKNAKWKDKKDQYIVAVWGIKNGYAKWWTCYRKLYGNMEIN